MVSINREDQLKQQSHWKSSDVGWTDSDPYLFFEYAVDKDAEQYVVDFPKRLRPFDLVRTGALATQEALPGPRLRYSNLPIFPVEMSLDLPTTNFVVSEFRNFAIALATNTIASSSFVHPVLLRARPMHPTVASVFALCKEAIAPSPSRRHRSMILQALHYCVGQLVLQYAVEKMATESLLLATQALVLAIVTLYLGLVEVDEDTMRHPHWIKRQQWYLNVLSTWTHRLWDLAPWEMPAHKDETTKWLTGESIRRTLIISLMVPDLIANLENGNFVFSGAVSALPFDERLSLWDDVQSEGVFAGGCNREEWSLKRTRLRSYRELTEHYEAGRLPKVVEHAPFARLLLVCCMGYNDVVGRSET